MTPKTIREIILQHTLDELILIWGKFKFLFLRFLIDISVGHQ